MRYTRKSIIWSALPCRQGRKCAAIRPYVARKRCACPEDWHRCMRRSRCPVGCCAFSARFLREWGWQCSPPGRLARLAAPELVSWSVMITRGTYVNPWSSFRKNCVAARLSRWRWPTISRTVPAWSTARHREWCSPWLVRRTSSRGPLSPGLDRRRNGWAYCWPNFRHQYRTASQGRRTPPAAIISSTVRALRQQRK
jgi:hypothetical protein